MERSKKKLALSRNTVRMLTSGELDRAVGGARTTLFTCGTLGCPTADNTDPLCVGGGGGGSPIATQDGPNCTLTAP